MAVAWFLRFPAMREHGVWYLLYLSNINVTVYGLTGGLAHFWSLAVEEQFYLVWPIFILFLPRRVWRTSIIMVMVLSAISRTIYISHGGHFSAYVLLWCRADALVLGAWMAISEKNIKTMLLIGIGLLGFASFYSEPLSSSLSESGMVFLSGALVLAVIRGAFHHILSTRPFTLLGGISYGVYVWGGIISPVALYALGVETLGWANLLISATTTIAISTISWHFVEKPMNGFKRHFTV